MCVRRTDMQTFARIWREPRLGLSGVGSQIAAKSILVSPYILHPGRLF